MEKKRYQSVILKFMFMVLFLCFSSAPLTGIKANAKTKEWSSIDSQWYCADKNVYYMIGNTFYVSPSEPHAMGERKKIAGWKINGSDHLEIVHGYGNNVFINKTNGLDGKSVLYAVNIKSGKKRKVSGRCSIVAAKGKYMYGNADKVSDTGAYPVYVWKITGNSVKKIKTLGKFIFGTTIVKNKAYFASYPDSSQKKMTVYSCRVDGSQRKKLFVLEGKGDFCQVLISDINEKTITVFVSGDEPGEYMYTIKNGKLKKK